VLNNIGFQQARRKHRAAAISVARIHIARRRACGADYQCIYNAFVYSGLAYQYLGADIMDQLGRR
jgi:hypothetical protein